MSARSATIGRRAAQSIFYGAVCAMILAGAYQISLQLFGGRPVAVAADRCEPELRRLAAAVDRARTAASGTEGEDEAVANFRAALEPEWSTFAGVAEGCRGQPQHVRLLAAIERLRYAEEHAVRREAGDLAPIRRKVNTMLGTTPNAPSGSSTGPEGRVDDRPVRP